MPDEKQTCPDCKGTGKYVGLGFSPPEDCKKCEGRGFIQEHEAPVPYFDPFEIDFKFTNTTIPKQDAWMDQYKCCMCGCKGYQLWFDADADMTCVNCFGVSGVVIGIGRAIPRRGMCVADQLVLWPPRSFSIKDDPEYLDDISYWKRLK